MKKILSIFVVLVLSVGILFPVTAHARNENALDDGYGNPSLIGVFNGETKRLQVDSNGYVKAVLTDISSLTITGSSTSGATLVITQADTGGTLNMTRSAASSISMVRIIDDHADTTGITLEIRGDADASASAPIVKFFSNSGAHDQPVLQIKQSGTGVALFLEDGVVQYSSETLETTNAGVAADITSMITILTTDAGGADINAVSLADGVIGQTKIFTFKTETTAGDTIVITPATPVGFSTVTFDAVGDTVTMVFDGTSWMITGNQAATIG